MTTVWTEIVHKDVNIRSHSSEETIGREGEFFLLLTTTYNPSSISDLSLTNRQMYQEKLVM